MGSQEILTKLSEQHGKVLDAITGGLRDVRAAEQAILRACNMAGRLHYELENQTAETMKELRGESKPKWLQEALDKGSVVAHTYQAMEDYCEKKAKPLPEGDEGAEPPQASEVMSEAHIDRRLDGVRKDFERLEGRLSALEGEESTEGPQDNESNELNRLFDLLESKDNLIDAIQDRQEQLGFRCEGLYQEKRAHDKRITVLEDARTVKDDSTPLPEGQVPIDVAEFHEGRQVWRRACWDKSIWLVTVRGRDAIQIASENGGIISESYWFPKAEDVLPMVATDWEAWPRAL